METTDLKNMKQHCWSVHNIHCVCITLCTRFTNAFSCTTYNLICHVCAVASQPGTDSYQLHSSVSTVTRTQARCLRNLGLIPDGRPEIFFFFAASRLPLGNQWAYAMGNIDLFLGDKLARASWYCHNILAQTAVKAWRKWQAQLWDFRKAMFSYKCMYNTPQEHNPQGIVQINNQGHSQ